MMFSDEIRSICSTDLPGDDHDPSGHRRRLRVRMEKEGWDALRPHEMLELALYPILPRQDLSGLARTLVDRFGSLRDVFDAPPEALAECPGMTETLARWICVTGELLRAYCDALEEDGLRLGCFGDIRRIELRMPQMQKGFPRQRRGYRRSREAVSDKRRFLFRHGVLSHEWGV